MFLSKSEEEIVKTALYYAIKWEKSLIDYIKNSEDSEELTGTLSSCKVNIRDFETLRNKIK